MATLIQSNELGLTFETDENFVLNQTITNTYFDEIIASNLLPFPNANIHFSDDIWDFSIFSKLNVEKKSMRFHFESSPTAFKSELKKYVLVKVLENNNKTQTINRKFNEIRMFFSYLSQENIHSIHEVTPSILRNYLDTRKMLSLKSIRMTKMSILDFYQYYSANYVDIYSSELRDLLDLGSSKAYKAASKENRTPNIDEDYFQAFIKAIISMIKDQDEPPVMRAIACIYLILSQTGLRLSEVLALETNSLQETTINHTKTNYLLYKTWKRTSGDNSFHMEKTYVNELTEFAFKQLVEIYSNRRADLNIEYLFLGGENKKKESQFPIDISAFSKLRERFFIHIDKYIPTININPDSFPNLSTVKVFKGSKNGIPIATLTFPNTHQFRVHMATDLYNKGVPLQYVEKFMGHLTTEMQGYYYRPSKDNPQENLTFSIDTIKGIITGDTKILGDKANELSDRITDFIKKNHFNVEKDIEEIARQLSDKIPIRQKTGGVCIKSSILRDCSKDAPTNEFFCAYSVCPNIFHFYYMVGVSLRQTKELVASIELNKTRNHQKQAQKEINMLSTIIRKRLIPELQELERMISIKGVDSIIESYPDLEEIVLNLNQINEEVTKWKQLIS